MASDFRFSEEGERPVGATSRPRVFIKGISEPGGVQRQPPEKAVAIKKHIRSQKAEDFLQVSE